MAYVITEPCIRDGACAEVCPVECIVPGPEDEGAIYPEDEVPEEYTEWIAKNRAFYEEGPGYSAA